MTTLRYDSPCGELLLAADGEALCVCDWTAGAHHPLLAALRPSGSHAQCEAERRVLALAACQLDEYFAAARTRFDVPIRPEGTLFRRKIWRALMDVDCGQTMSYSALAAAAGCPSAVRAVAGAVAANPLSIFIPCHRIVGSSGRLTGYAGGLEAKKRLLRLEGHPY